MESSSKPSKAVELILALDPRKIKRGEPSPLRRPLKAADFDFSVDGVE
jgi:hypothetical protein